MGNDEATLKPMTIRSACNVATTAGTAGQARGITWDLDRFYFRSSNHSVNYNSNNDMKY